MKRNLFLACVALLMVSCKTTQNYYQVVEVKSSNLQKENSNYVYNDGRCKLTYDFWAEGGDAGFRLENLTDEVLYVNLENSFYIENGVSYDYYKARTFEFGKNIQIATGSSKLAAAYGLWSVGVLGAYPGSVANQKSSSVSSSSGSSISYAEKPVVMIPPHTSKTFGEYRIMSDVIQDCSVNLFVKKEKTDGMTFTESESPIRFANYITYRIGENGEPQAVTNNFYLGGFTNYRGEDVTKTVKVGCKNSVTKKYFDKSGADRFYVNYDNLHNNDYSKDTQSWTSGNKSNDEIYDKVMEISAKNSK